MSRRLPTVFILIFFIFVTPVFGGEDTNYDFLKVGSGRTVETALAYASITRGFYVNPSHENSDLSKTRRRRLNWLTTKFSSLSNTLIGSRLDRERLFYGFESSGAYVADSQITEKIDLSVVGKAHYWLNSDKNWYLGVGGGGAYNELRDENQSGFELGIGGHLFFATELELGKRVEINDNNYYVTLTWVHRSNAGIEENNTGMNPIVFSLARRF